MPQHWMGIGMGRSGVFLSAVASFYDSASGSYDSQELRAELVLEGDESKRRFAHLHAEKDRIEAELEQTLTWHNPEEAKMCRIYTRKTVNLYDREEWSSHHGWLLDQLERFKAVFGPRIRDL